MTIGDKASGFSDFELIWLAGHGPSGSETPEAVHLEIHLEHGGAEIDVTLKHGQVTEKTFELRAEEGFNLNYAQAEALHRFLGFALGLIRRPDAGDTSAAP